MAIDFSSITNSIFFGFFIIFLFFIRYFVSSYILKRKKFSFLQVQSVENEKGERTSIYGKGEDLVTTIFPEVTTVYQSLLHGLKVSDNGPLFGSKIPNSNNYSWVSYKQVITMSKRFGSALSRLSCGTEAPVGVFSSNCLEWNITAEGSSMFGIPLVPFYSSLDDKSIIYIIQQSKLQVLVCENWEKSYLILSLYPESCNLKNIIIINDNDNNNYVSDIKEGIDFTNESQIEKNLNLAKKHGVEIMTFSEAMSLGLKNPVKPNLPTPETICSIIYTSGTTGIPKGVVLTHKALVANISALIAFDVHKKLTPDANDIHISYLPAAHGFERINQLLFITNGARIGFSNPRDLLEDIQALNPSYLITVPRVLNKIYQKVMEEIEKNIIKKIIFKFSLRMKLKMLKEGIITKNSIYDKFVFHKIQNILGGRINVCICGSSPLSEDVLNFARGSFGCMVFEGYGQTELGVAVAITMPFETQPGVVGPPLPNCKIKLIDCPEVGCYVNQGSGEICIKSTSCMEGYFNNPEATSGTLDSEGFIKSGDVGLWTKTGSLKIIDRSKNMFKLAQGEYVSPGKVEEVYLKSPFIQQIFVDGNAFQSYPVAIVIPNMEIIEKNWSNFTEPQNQEIPRDPPPSSTHFTLPPQQIKEFIKKDLKERGKNYGLKGFEQIFDLELHHAPFTVEEGHLTPTMKMKRGYLRKLFKNELDSMFSKQNAFSCA